MASFQLLNERHRMLDDALLLDEEFDEDVAIVEGHLLSFEHAPVIDTELSNSTH